MRIIKTVLVVIALILLMSCGGNTNKQPASAAGFLTIEKDIKSKFGEDAYYTGLTVTYNKSIGNIIGVTVTEDPASLKMGQWNNTQGNWSQNSEISLEVPEGSKASDFMFKLDETISLTTLGELVEKSIQKLKDDGKLDNPTLSIASINFPDNGNVSKTEYIINFKPKNGGTTFNFYYTLDGKLRKMDY